MIRNDNKFYIILVLFLAVGFYLTACSPGLEPVPKSQPTAQIIPLDDLDEWDLVWISDSSGSGATQIYARMIEEDTGKKVNLSDNWIGSLPAGAVLNALQGKPTSNMKLKTLADQLRKAEVIVFYGNPNESINESNPGDSNCLAPGLKYVNSCSPEEFSVYVSDLESIYQLIFDLRSGQPTILRAFDAYNPIINQLRDQGVYQECKQCWGLYNDAIRQGAQKYNIPVALVSEAWNGPEWDQDPNDLGYTKDGEHLQRARG